MDHNYEVDELCTYVGSKKNKCWITYALDRQTGQVADIRIGRRNKKTLKGVISTLLLGQANIYTDGFGLYKLLIPKNIHRLARYGTNCIERKNLTLRTHLKRLNRLTLSFSKSIRMLEASVKLYLWSC